MIEDRRSVERASVWNRFWFPRAYIETWPADASPQEMREISARNAKWLKAHMNVYIRRWGVLCAFTVTLAIATDDDTPSLLSTVAIAATLVSSLGLGAMLCIYRRAWKALEHWPESE